MIDVKTHRKVIAKFEPLLKPTRYKAAYGGRGGGKSHFFGEEAVFRMFQGGFKIACIRENQNSLKESVRQLLIDKIAKFGWNEYFDVKNDEINGPGGSHAIFRGMKHFNAESLKSIEGFDAAWVEEAQTFSEASLRTLRPTIRKAGSELWFSWNPRHDTDPVDVFFRGSRRFRDDEAAIVEVNWNDNPLLDAVSIREKEMDYDYDSEMAEHVWGGGYLIITEGSYFARLISAAENEGRIGDFPYNPNLPLRTAWDIGVRDFSVIWFVQDDGFSPTVVDYYEISGDGAEQIVRTALPEHMEDMEARRLALAALGRPQAFKYKEHLLPHDVKVREWGGGARSRVEILKGFGLENITPGIPHADADRIAAVRSILPNVRFNNIPRVAMGVKRLRRFRRKWNDMLNTYTTPFEDDNIHAADAFGEYAVNADLVTLKSDLPRAKPRDETALEIDAEGRLVNNVNIMEWAEKQRRRRMIGMR